MSKSSHERLSLKSDSTVERKHKLARGGLALLLAGTVLTGAGCSGDKVGAQAPEVNPSTTTESVAEPTETVEDYAGAMEVYKEMSVEEFESLPRDERLKYAQFLIDETVEAGFYDLNYNSSEYEIKPVEINLENTSQEILDSYQHALQNTFLQANIGGAQRSYDRSTGAKMLSGVFYNVGEGYVSNEYLKYKDFTSSIEQPSKFDYSLNVSESGEVSRGIDQNSGEEVWYVDIKYTSTKAPENVNVARFVYSEFDNYDGTKGHRWLMEVGLGEGEDFSVIKVQ